MCPITEQPSDPEMLEKEAFLSRAEVVVEGAPLGQEVIGYCLTRCSTFFSSLSSNISITKVGVLKQVLYCFSYKKINA